MTGSALILVDLQNDYFPGGRFPLAGIEAALAQAARALAAARASGEAIIHVRHESAADAPFFTAGSSGADIHVSVRAKAKETVILKHFPNSFRDTALKAELDVLGIEEVTIVGAMSHMCIDAATRAAADLGYECHLAHDACATLAMEWGGIKVPAAQVHAAFMAALQFGYAQVQSTDELLEMV